MYNIDKISANQRGTKGAVIPRPHNFSRESHFGVKKIGEFVFFFLLQMNIRIYCIFLIRRQQVRKSNQEQKSRVNFILLHFRRDVPGDVFPLKSPG